jgi:hypothetical protein
MTVVVIEAQDVIKRVSNRAIVGQKGPGSDSSKLLANEPVPEKRQSGTKMIAAGVYLLSVTDPTFE